MGRLDGSRRPNFFSLNPVLSVKNGYQRRFRIVGLFGLSSRRYFGVFVLLFSVPWPLIAGTTNHGEQLSVSADRSWEDGGQRYASRSIAVTLGNASASVTDTYVTPMGGVHSAQIYGVASNGSTTPIGNAVYNHSPNGSGTQTQALSVGALQWYWVTFTFATWENGQVYTTHNFWFKTNDSNGSGGTQGAPSKQSYRYTFTNLQPYPVRYVVEVDGVIVKNELVQPGATVTGVAEFDNGSTPVTKVFVPADFSDGGWVEAPLNPIGTGTGATTGGNDYITLPGGDSTAPHQPGDPPATPVNNQSVGPGTPGMPAGGAIQPASQTTWITSPGTSDTERLDKSTYRQGVDKQIDADKKAADKLKERDDARDAAAQTFLNSLAEKVTEATTEAANKKTELEGSIGTQLSEALPAAPTIPGGGGGGGNVNMVIPSLKNHYSFPNTLNINPVTSALVPDWLKSVFSLVRALMGYCLVVWLFIVTGKDVSRALLSLAMVHRDGDSAAERAALNIPYVGGVVALALRYSLIAWIAAAIYAAIPLAIAIYDSSVFGEATGYLSTLNSVLGSSGPLGQLAGMLLSIVPLATGLAVLAARMTSQGVIMTGIVPVAMVIRAFKI